MKTNGRRRQKAIGRSIGVFRLIGSNDWPVGGRESGSGASFQRVVLGSMRKWRPSLKSRTENVLK